MTAITNGNGGCVKDAADQQSPNGGAMTSKTRLPLHHDTRSGGKRDATEPSPAQQLGEYGVVQLLPSGVKILKRSNDNGEPGGSVAKLVGKINSKNLLKQKAKKEKDGESCGGVISSREREKKSSKHKRKTSHEHRHSASSPQSTSPFKLPKPHSIVHSSNQHNHRNESSHNHPHPSPNHPHSLSHLSHPSSNNLDVSKETSQGEISHRLHAAHSILSSSSMTQTLTSSSIPGSPSPNSAQSDNFSLPRPSNGATSSKAASTVPKTASTVSVSSASVVASKDRWWRDMTILIHLIDGFEIEEADSPFPVLKGELPEKAECGNDQGIEKELFITNREPSSMRPKRQSECEGNNVNALHSRRVGAETMVSSESAPPPAKIPKQSSCFEDASIPEVKHEVESPKKNANQALHQRTEDGTGSIQREIDHEEEDEEEDDSISIGSKELMSQEEMMNVDYASSPPSHSPVSFPLRDVSSTDSFPSSSYHQLDHCDDEELLVDEKPAIFLCGEGKSEGGGGRGVEAKNIVDWTERDVYQFISGIEGCSQYAEEFISQEIDGQALVLLNEDHLMSNLNVKLGPALKILAKIQEHKK